MFSLKNQTVKIKSFNPRTEQHGAEKVPAADIGIEFNAPNYMLSEFGQQLRDALYWNSGEQPEQGELIEPAVDKPNLRAPEMKGPFKLTTEVVGADCIIDWGLGDKSNIDLGDCEVNNFTIDSQEGGTVTVSFRVQCHPNETDAGKLCGLVQQETKMTLIAPSIEAPAI